MQINSPLTHFVGALPKEEPIIKTSEVKKMQENYTVCHCEQVSYNDIADALDKSKSFDDVLSAFEDVQRVTKCSTGCGGCHQKVLDIISEIMMEK